MNIATIVRSLGTLSLSNFARKHGEKATQHPAPEIRELGQRIAEAVADLENAYAARRPLRAMWSDAAALKNAADDALDAELRRISYDLLGPSHLDRDRNAAGYRVLFPSGNLDFLSGPDRAEIAQVRAIVSYFSSNADHPMASHGPSLAAKVQVLEDRLTASTEAEARLRAAEALESEKRTALGRALRKSVLFLRDFFEGDESKVDALFPTLAEANVKEEPEPPPPV